MAILRQNFVNLSGSAALRKILRGKQIYNLANSHR